MTPWKWPRIYYYAFISIGIKSGLKLFEIRDIANLESIQALPLKFINVTGFMANLGNLLHFRQNLRYWVYSDQSRLCLLKYMNSLLNLRNYWIWLKYEILIPILINPHLASKNMLIHKNLRYWFWIWLIWIGP